MRLTAHGITGQQAEDKDPCPNLEDFKKSARDLLIRINRLEQRQLKVRHLFKHPHSHRSSFSEIMMTYDCLIGRRGRAGRH